MKCVRLIFCMIGLMVLYGCDQKVQPLRVCVDLEYIYDGAVGVETAVYDFEHSIKETGGITDVVFEYLPYDGVERETQKDRLYTEIMAGGGPDVFIIACDGAQWHNPSENAIFQMPEKAMEVGLFMPLDSYIKKAKHAEWDELNQTVLSAGKNKRGQQLVPLTYTLPAIFYKSSNLQHTPDSSITWENMLSDETMYDSAARLCDGELIIGDVGSAVDFRIDYVLGELADFSKEELLFTEEELKLRIDQIMQLKGYAEQSGILDEPFWSDRYIGNHCTASEYNGKRESNGLNPDDEFTFVPLYSDDGGLTAMVLSYAAINANTRRPEDAFTVVDLLMRTHTQQYAPIYKGWLYSKGAYGIPMDNRLMQKDYPLTFSQYRAKWYFSPENYDTYCVLRNQITNVQFPGSLNIELEKLMIECSVAYKNGKDYSDLISESYRKMDMMIGE